MLETELLDLVHRIAKEKKFEDNRIELKAARDGIPKVYDTLSSFSNQDQGGIILFGIDENASYEPCGVKDLASLTKGIEAQCDDMRPPVRANLTSTTENGRSFLAAEIPSLPYFSRPCFYAGIGMQKGSYIRVGQADKKMTPYEIYAYESYRSGIRDDLEPVPDLEDSLMDQNALKLFLLKARMGKGAAVQGLSDDQILELMGVKSHGAYTKAACLCFCRYPQRYFPRLGVSCVATEANSLGNDAFEDKRFEDSAFFGGNIPAMLEDGISWMRKNLKVRTYISPETGVREDREEIPLSALREALLNALAHRDYGRMTSSLPVSVECYADRVEIKSPGHLYGGADLSELGETRLPNRNEALLGILEILGTMENRFSGVPTMRKSMDSYGLEEPEFVYERDDFCVVFRKQENHQKELDLKKRILSFCETPRSREELIAFTGMSRYYTMSVLVKSLVQEGKIELSDPGHPASRKQTYQTREG